MLIDLPLNMASTSEDGSQALKSSAEAKQSSMAVVKRARITPDRLQLVANTLMEENNVLAYGILLKTTAKGQFLKGSGPVLKAFQKFLNEKNRPVLAGCTLGNESMSSWIKEIKSIAATEAERRQSIAERGRNSSDDPDQVKLIFVHASN